MIRIFCIIICFAFSTITYGQVKDLKDSVITIPLFTGSYAVQIPGGDMADRFGINSNTGVSFLLKFRSNWLIGAEGYFLFGNDVREDGILDSIKTSNGEIINKYGEFAAYIISERGFFIGGTGGKIIPVIGPNRNSGIIMTLSGGLLQHKIRIDNDSNNAPQILGDYKKGYDRLTNGICIKEFIGYMHFGNKNAMNFYAGFEFYQGFTKNRRTYNFDTMGRDDRKRTDLLYSFRAGWIIPIYKRATDREYYF